MSREQCADCGCITGKQIGRHCIKGDYYCDLCYRNIMQEAKHEMRSSHLSRKTAIDRARFNNQYNCLDNIGRH